jgi:hypothetical protein
MENSRKKRERAKQKLHDKVKGSTKQQWAKKSKRKSEQTDLREPANKNRSEFSAGKNLGYKLEVRTSRELA